MQGRIRGEPGPGLGVLAAGSAHVPLQHRVREQRAGPQHAVPVDHEAAAAVALDVGGVRGLALQHGDVRALVQLVVRRREPVPAPRGPAGDTVRSRRESEEPQDRLLGGAGGAERGPGLTAAAPRAAGEARALLGPGREARTRPPWGTGERGQRGRGGAQPRAATAPPAAGGRRAARPGPRGGLGSRLAASPRRRGPRPHLPPPRPGPRRPPWGRRTPGGGTGLGAPPGSRPRPGARLSHPRGPRAGGAHLAEPRTWPGRGAGPRAPNPGFGASGFEGGGRLGFPRCPRNHAPSQPSPARPLASRPRIARGVAARGLALREREGAWPGGFFLKWLRLRPARAEGDVAVGQQWLFWRDLPGRTGPHVARGGGWRGFVLARSFRVPGAAPPPAGAGPQGLGRPRGSGHLRAQCRGLGGMLPRLLSAGPGGRQARYRRDRLSRFLGVLSPSWAIGAPRARAGSVPGQRARGRGVPTAGARLASFLAGPAAAPTLSPRRCLWLPGTNSHMHPGCTEPPRGCNPVRDSAPGEAPPPPLLLFGGQVSSSFPLDGVSPPTPRCASWVGNRGLDPGPRAPPPVAGQRATESQKQLLSPEHSSCAWISFPALLPEQRPGPQGGAVPTPDASLGRTLPSGWKERVDVGEPGGALVKAREQAQGLRTGPPQPAARSGQPFASWGQTTPSAERS